MRRHAWLCVAVCGCGFQARAVDGSSSDGGLIGSVPVDAPAPPSGCIPRWLAGDVALAMPSLLDSISTGASERDPWISSDGLRLYFSRDPDGIDGSDIFLATRTDPKLPFTTAAPVTNLNTAFDEGRPALTPDELVLVMTSNRGPDDIPLLTTQIVTIDRPDTTTPFGTPDSRHMDKVNSVAGNHLDPFLSPDGRQLYFAPDGPPFQHIMIATRSDRSADFGQPADLPNLGTGDSLDPAISQDQRVLVFTSTRAIPGPGHAATNLWYATRAEPGDPFGAPQPMPSVNSDSFEGDPVLSADGCALYFVSNRPPGAPGDFDLYTTTVVPDAGPSQ